MTNLTDTVTQLQNSFVAEPRSLDSTIEYLQKFEKLLCMGFEPIANSLKDDFHRATFETFALEYSILLGELSHLKKHIRSLLKAEPQGPISATCSTMNIKIEKIALGSVLVISPFNYPFLLGLSPLIGAFASGNNVVLKLPGDQLPKFTSVLKKIIESVFDSKHVLVVDGGVPESTELLSLKFDKILFTGSTAVGRIVHTAAAKTLTPVILELGGKSPVFVTKSASSLSVLVRRLLWGKFTNSGQTCVAPDYVLVDAEVYDQFIKAIETEFNSAYKDITPETDYTHLINSNAFNRLSGYLKATKGKILLGGASSESDHFIQPTIVTNVDWDDILMQEEIFGPILPIIKYHSLEDTVAKVIQEHDTPLAVYILGDSPKETELIKKIRSGSIAINEFLMTAGCHSTPFGGIGTSGIGNYHSKWSIDSFTHQRTIIKQPIWVETLLKSRYFPYNDQNFFAMSILTSLPDLPIVSWSSIFFFFLTFGLGAAVGVYGSDIFNYFF